MPDMVPDKLLLYDGVCNLCNGLVAFVFRNDRRGRVHFAPLESHFAARITGGRSRNIDTAVYIRGGDMYLRSDAVLHLLRDMGGGFRLFYLLRFLPAGFRNWVYDRVAANRYQWFGRKEECPLPPRGWEKRFHGFDQRV